LAQLPKKGGGGKNSFFERVDFLTSRGRKEKREFSNRRVGGKKVGVSTLFRPSNLGEGKRETTVHRLEGRRGKKPFSPASKVFRPSGKKKKEREGRVPCGGGKEWGKSMSSGVAK